MVAEFKNDRHEQRSRLLYSLTDRTYLSHTYIWTNVDPISDPPGQEPHNVRRAVRRHRLGDRRARHHRRVPPLPDQPGDLHLRHRHGGRIPRLRQERERRQSRVSGMQFDPFDNCLKKLLLLDVKNHVIFEHAET